MRAKTEKVETINMVGCEAVPSCPSRCVCPNDRHDMMDILLSRSVCAPSAIEECTRSSHGLCVWFAAGSITLMAWAGASNQVCVQYRGCRPRRGVRVRAVCPLHCNLFVCVLSAPSRPSVTRQCLDGHVFKITHSVCAFTVPCSSTDGKPLFYHMKESEWNVVANVIDHVIA